MHQFQSMVCNVVKTYLTILEYVDWTEKHAILMMKSCFFSLFLAQIQKRSHHQYLKCMEKIMELAKLDRVQMSSYYKKVSLLEHYSALHLQWPIQGFSIEVINWYWLWLNELFSTLNYDKYLFFQVSVNRLHCLKPDLGHFLLFLALRDLSQGNTKNEGPTKWT